MFPGLSGKIKGTEISSSTTTASTVTVNNGSDGNKSVYFDKPNEVTNELVSCALLDLREGTTGETVDKKYFKSEVVVRDKTHGWIMWNGLSFTSEKKVVFEYRLLLLKKENETWSIDKGFGWNSPTTTDTATIDRLVTALPEGQTWTEETLSDSSYSKRKTWAGIAKLDSSGTKHLIQSLGIYLKSSSGTGDQQYAEFFGNSGTWSESTGVGYQQVNKTYSSADNDSGWKTLSANILLGDSLKHWYSPFRENGKNVKWTTCEQWSADTTRSPESITSSSVDETIRSLCYSSTSTNS